MRTRGRPSLCAIVALLAGAVAAAAGERARECWADFDAVEGRIVGREQLRCRDGQRRCDADGEADGACTFSLRICAARPKARCKIGQVRRIVVSGAAIELPALPTRTEQCGPPATVRVPTGTERRIDLKARARGHRRPDRDTLLLRCTGPVPCEASCPDNPGGPNALELAVAPAGSDLDLGRTGSEHNAAVPAGATLQLCLTECNARSDPLCEAEPHTRDCNDEPALLGPPMPLFTAGIPVCLVTRFAAGAAAPGSANVQTGEIDLPLNVETDVLLTEEAAVCPSCEAGLCTSGPRAQKPCGVHGVVLVPDAARADKLFKVSKDCPPPDATPAGTIRLPLRMTTGTSVLTPLPGGTAATPCIAQPGEPVGLVTRSDSCPLPGTCTVACEGHACSTSGVDYATGEPACVDRKGGLAQRCCSTSRSTPCFPTAPEAGGQLIRVGAARAPTPPWPEPSYPKTAACDPGSCTVLASTFCLPATGTMSVEGLWGLPGPGAVLVPVTTEWRATAVGTLSP